MFSTVDADEEEHLSSCIPGYHIYNGRWSSAIVGEKLQCAKEVGNVKNRYAISVLQGPDVVGHLPQKISTIITSSSCNIMLHVLIT